MGIHVHEFISLDGGISEPTWTFAYGFDPRMGDVLAATTGRAEGILLGRTTYDMFELPGRRGRSRTTRERRSSTTPPSTSSPARCRTRPGATPGWWAATTPTRSARSRPSRQPLRQRLGTLVRAMLADGLVDEIHLFVYPLTLGEGSRLFPEGHLTTFALAESQSYDNGVLYLNYRATGD